MPRASFTTRSTSRTRSSHFDDLDEEEAGSGNGYGVESTRLISSSTSTSSATTGMDPRRLSRIAIGSLYGTTPGHQHYIHVDQQESQRNAAFSAGGGMRRTESILKLQGLIEGSGEYQNYRVPEEEIQLIGNRRVRDFYRDQNAILDSFLEVDEILDNARALGSGETSAGPVIPSLASAEKRETLAVQIKLAINVNLLVNVALLAAKVAVVLLSNSMSLIASTVDSLMDLLSTIIIYGTSRVIERRTWQSEYDFPTGKRRMEPMSVLIFSVIMISSFLQVFIESAHRLLDPDLQPTQIPTVGIVAMVITIVVKSLIWLWCRTIKNTSVEALTLDAENDIVFNFFSLVFPLIGQKLGWKYLDPLGGAILSVYIIVEWSRTLLENASKLTGKRASPAEHQRVAYLLTRFSPLIKGIQHVSVYASGDHNVVEADIIVDERLGLRTSHNIGESAQYGLEQLDGVERAFVHLDIAPNALSGHVNRS